jgi:hypothetical protein
MYLVIPILFAQRQPPELKGLVDGTLVFGTPLAAAFMQSGLVRDMPYGLAWSAGCACFLYGLLATTTLRRDRMRMLGETYVALAIVFLTLAIFFALDAYPTFALWTLEGAALFWVGLRQRRLLARLFGLALQLAGTFYFVIKYSDYSLANPWLNDFVLGCVIIAAAGFIIAWLMHRYRDAVKQGVEPGGGVLRAWGALWWAIGGVVSRRGACYMGRPLVVGAPGLLGRAGLGCGGHGGRNGAPLVGRAADPGSRAVECMDFAVGRRVVVCRRCRPGGSPHRFGVSDLVPPGIRGGHFSGSGVARAPAEVGRAARRHGSSRTGDDRNPDLHQRDRRATAGWSPIHRLARELSHPVLELAPPAAGCRRHRA